MSVMGVNIFKSFNSDDIMQARFFVNKVREMVPSGDDEGGGYRG